MKKFCAILFSFVLVLMLALPVAAEDAAGESDSLFDTAPALTAPAGYVVNLDTNIVVYEKNSETQLSAASLTKMMTTLLLLENYQDQLDSISLTAPSYIYDLIWEQSTNASTADIRRGETQSLRLVVHHGDEVVNAAAAHVVGHDVGGLVAAGQQHGVEQVAQALRLAPADIGRGCVGALLPNQVVDIARGGQADGVELIESL